MSSGFVTRIEKEKDEPYTVIFTTDDHDKYRHIEDECRKMIGHAKPTVDAVPVRHGLWVKTGQSFLFPERFMNYSCSLCGYDIDKTKHRYCPNCGAKMDGGADDETL